MVNALFDMETAFKKKRKIQTSQFLSTTKKKWKEIKNSVNSRLESNEAKKKL